MPCLSLFAFDYFSRFSLFRLPCCYAFIADAIIDAIAADAAIHMPPAAAIIVLLIFACCRCFSFSRRRLILISLSPALMFVTPLLFATPVLKLPLIRYFFADCLLIIALPPYGITRHYATDTLLLPPLPYHYRLLIRCFDITTPFRCRYCFHTKREAATDFSSPFRHYAGCYHILLIC